MPLYLLSFLKMLKLINSPFVLLLIVFTCYSEKSYALPSSTDSAFNLASELFPVFFLFHPAVLISDIPSIVLNLLLRALVLHSIRTFLYFQWGAGNLLVMNGHKKQPTCWAALWRSCHLLSLSTKPKDCSILPPSEECQMRAARATAQVKLCNSFFVFHTIIHQKKVRDKSTRDMRSDMTNDVFNQI